MEKLIELFNEYERPQTNHIYTAYEVKENMNRLDILQEFIKWLVDNDKIDFESENYPLKKYYPYFNDDVLAIVSQDCNTYEDRCKVCYDKYESLLMLLAISDNPIDFLIKILK